MRQTVVSVLLALVMVVGCAGSGLGQKWTAALEHKMYASFDEADRLGSRISGLAAYAERPPDPVEWPTFQCTDPAYGRLYLPGLATDEGIPQRLFALDRSGGNGGKYDILYLDLNGNNRFGEGERIEGMSAKVRGGQDGIDFGTITFPVKRPGHDGLHIRIWIGPQTIVEGRRQYVLVNYRPWCYLGGEVEMDGKTVPVRLADVNVNGTFTDRGTDTIAIGDAPPTTLSRLTGYGGKFVTVEVADDASSVTISPYQGKTGTLKLDVAKDSGTITQVYGVVTTDDGISLQCRSEGDKGFELPAGNYRIGYVMIFCEDGDLEWNTYFRELATSVSADAETQLKPGKPMKLDVLVSGATFPAGQATVQYSVRGALGETYQTFTCRRKDGKTAQVNNPKVVIRNAAGETVVDGVMEPG
jgi:hypothetical protein